MNDRARAISILQKAREILSDRLTQKVLEAEGEILDDAEGQCYLSEIETLYEQMGGRLAHLNSMLSNLPALEEKRVAEAVATESVYTDLSSAYATGVDLEPTTVTGPLALPAPLVSADRPQLAPPAVTFQSFALQIETGDVEGAGRSLAELFNVDAARGRRCAEFFYSKLMMQPDFFGRALRLRTELTTGSVNGSLLLLWECFGLQGLESLGVLQTLKARLAASGDAREEA